MGDVWRGKIGVHQTRPNAQHRQSDREIHRDRRLAHAALATQDGDDLAAQSVSRGSSVDEAADLNLHRITQKFVNQPRLQCRRLFQCQFTLSESDPDPVLFCDDVGGSPWRGHDLLRLASGVLGVRALR